MTGCQTSHSWQGTLHVVAPSAPPKICGVGDHTAQLVSALARRGEVLVHCGQVSPSPRFEGNQMVQDFDSRFPWTLKPAFKASGIRAGDTVFLQYTNFAYGRYGFNPWMAPALAYLRRRGVRVITMFHETYMPASEGWKAAIMGWWQRQFFRQIGRNSDVCFFSVEPWVRKYGPWFPGRLVQVLPVGSNIPRLEIDRARVRASYGIPEGVPCYAIFGGTHPSRLFEWIAAASQRLLQSGVDHRILHIGPNADRVKEFLPGAPLIELGILPEADVSRALGASDIMLAPISDGASTRRTSLISGMQHGLCCLSTLGSSTDASLAQQAGKTLLFAKDANQLAEIALELATDPQRVARLGSAAAAFYEDTFSWDAIAEKVALATKA